MKNQNQSRNEVYRVLSRYLSDSKGYISTFIDSKEAACFVSFFGNGPLVSFERPDSFIKKDNEVLIIEHFAIDGFEEYPNGGSKLAKKEKDLEEAFSELSESPEGIHMTSTIGVSSSYSGFLSNVIERFNRHYEQIDCYKQRLIDNGIADENTLFRVCFVMEEVSPLGTLTHDGEYICPVCLAKSNEFLDFFQTKTKVDWIISAVLIESLFHPYFAARAEINSLREHTLDYSNYQFLSGESVYYMQYKIVIPNEAKDEQQG